MKAIKIKPNKLNGEILIPPSKSMSHRAIICAGLSQGESIIDNVLLSDDIIATIDGLRALGVNIEIQSIENSSFGDICRLIVKGEGELELVEQVIDCNESGSTIRFLIPLGCLVDGEVIFKGRGKLVERPLGTYYDIFDKKNIKYKNSKGLLPLEIVGKLTSGTFEIPGDISSQFITGLLFALPLLEEDSRIVITSNLESKGYIDLTLEMLKRFSIDVVNKDYKEFIIRGKQKYKPCDYCVEGDFSQGAFYIVGGLLGDELICRGLNPKSKQGDRAIVDIVKSMGGDIEINDNRLIIRKSMTKGTIIDASQCPDIIPVLAVLASVSNGETRIINGARLRIKESDRLSAIKTELCKIGGEIVETEDGLIIQGVTHLKSGSVDSWNDHRIAMSMAIASISAVGDIELTGSEAVSKSYPHFWQDFKSLGGKFDE